VKQIKKEINIPKKIAEKQIAIRKIIKESRKKMLMLEAYDIEPRN